MWALKIEMGSILGWIGENVFGWRTNRNSRSNKELYQVAEMKRDWVRDNASPAKKTIYFYSLKSHLMRRRAFYGICEKCHDSVRRMMNKRFMIRPTLVGC